MAIHALSHPFLLFCACVLILQAAAYISGRSPVRTSRPQLFRVAAILPVAIFVCVAAFYLWTPAYVDHVEPSVASVSWAVVTGQPAYPDPSGYPMYGLPYGPMLFVANALLMRLLGPAILSSKLAGVIASVASVVVTAVALGRANARDRMSRIALMALLCLMFGAAAFWTRAEPLLLLCSSLAVLSLTLPTGPATVVAGAALGVALNLKVSALVYVAPCLVFLWKKHGSAALGGVAAIAAAIFAAPFFLSDSFSPSTYAYWIRSAMADGVRLGALPTALEWTALISIPLLTAATTSGSEPSGGQQVFRRYVLVALVLSLPLAIKYGTGHYHFLPFVPLIVFGADFKRWQALGPAAVFTACALIAAAAISTWLPALTALPSHRMIEELRTIERSNAGSLAMGYSANYRPTNYRPLLVFDGQPYVLDGASAMDWHWRNRPFPPAMTSAMRSCIVEAWVIPAGAAPFRLPSAYPASGDVFPDELRRAFEESYVRESSGEYFDVWRCRR